MRTWLQHSLNPLNLWSRLGGRFTFAFRLYEAYCWRPILRRMLGQNGNKEKTSIGGSSSGVSRRHGQSSAETDQSP